MVRRQESIWHYGYDDEVASSWVHGIVDSTVMCYCASHIW